MSGKEREGKTTERRNAWGGRVAGCSGVCGFFLWELSGNWVWRGFVGEGL